MEDIFHKHANSFKISERQSLCLPNRELNLVSREKVLT